MSYLIPNNQLQQSGVVPVVFVSGGLSNVVHGQFGASGAVPILAAPISGLVSGLTTFGLVTTIGASGTRWLTQINRFGVDEWSPENVGLLTNGTLILRRFTGDADSHITAYGINLNSGDRLVSGQPVSGVAQFVVNRIMGANGFLAEVNTSGALKVDATVNATAQVSGQTIFIGASGTTTLARINSSGALLVDATVTANADISGQTVYTASGNNNVQMSGQIAWLGSSGRGPVDTLNVNSGFNLFLTVPTSGIALRTISNIMGGDGSVADVFESTFDDGWVTDMGLVTHARMFGYFGGGSGFVRLRVTQSGQGMSGIPHKLAVDFSGSVTQIGASGIAGVVDVLNKSFSGGGAQTITLRPSGNALYTASLIVGPDGGNVVGVYAPSDDDFAQTTNILYAGVANYGFNQQSGVWIRERITSSGQGISGIPHRLVVALSGDPVSISGQAISVSGNIVNTSGQVSIISGQPVTVSGNAVTVSGNVVTTSGNVAVEFGTFMRTTSGTICTSLSGGTELGSGIIFSANVRNLSGNAPIYVGGVSGEAPFSGKGMILFSNESQEYRVDNFNKIRIFAATSGQRVRTIGLAMNA